MKSSRRNFIKKSMLATAVISSGLNAEAKAENNEKNADPDFISQNAKDNDSFKISVFSKNLQWLDYAEMAKVAAEIGFDGIDLTVRPKGHVLPERVEEDLPKAVTAIQEAGLQVYMITTGITMTNDPLAERILKTASSLGIRHYRMGWINYDERIGIEENLKKIKNQLNELALLNKKYSIQGEYQNHSGIYFGAPIWDLHSVLQQIESPWIGSQYDIYHATIEGANAWPIGLKLLKPYIKSINIKDFQWTKKEGRWLVESLPLGEGMVNFKEYLKLLKQTDISVPVSIHYEYALGGAESGATTLTIEKEYIITAMKKDLATLKNYLKEMKLTD